jgi:hypothetical protein
VNEIQDRDASFEERLLTELRAVVEERAAMPEAPGVERSSRYARASLHGNGRRLAPRLALGAAGVAAVAAGVLVVSSGTGDTSSAFAVEPQGDGTVRVEISSLSDAAGLEKALDEAGVKADVNYLAAGMTCKEPRWTPEPGVPHKREVAVGIKETPDGATFSINRDAVGAGETLLVTASPATAAGMGNLVGVQVAEGAVSTCDPVEAQAGELPPGAETNSQGLPPLPAMPDGAQAGSGPHTTGPQQGFQMKERDPKGLTQKEG